MSDKRFVSRALPFCGSLIAAAGLTGFAVVYARQKVPTTVEKVAAETPLVTGKAIAPQGEQTEVGSFPNNLLLSPDGKYVVATSSGARAFVSVLDVETGKLISKIGFNGPKASGGRGRAGLYYGLAFGPAASDGSQTLYAARGADAVVSNLKITPDGKISYTGDDIAPPEDDRAGDGLTFIAGIAVTPDGSRLIATNNSMDKARLDSAVFLLDTKTGKVAGSVAVPGYPFSVASVTAGSDAGRKVYVGSEQRPVLSVIDPVAGKLIRTIDVGSHPIGLAFDKEQKRLFVANANSDTLSIVDTASDKVITTVLLRPSEVRGLTGATPTGVAVSPDGATAYVSLADMNAVAVVDVGKGTVSGYIPAGWYPSAVTISPDGKRLFVANAKGVRTRNPNNVPFPPAMAAHYQPKYVQSVLEGTVSTIGLADAQKNLSDLTRLTLTANHIYAGLPEAAQTALSNPGIQHIFYIVKENRTYDQVLGDMPGSNGDRSLVMFGRDITPNLHALADRFVLLDNMYCCAEVSGDGWNWSTAGIANEYTARNVPYGYTGRTRSYDYEGTNNTVAVDLKGVPDAATPESGYIWDQVTKAGLSLRNYGFFTDDVRAPRETAENGTRGQGNSADKKALAGVTDMSFRQFDLNYADSDAWVKLGVTPFAKQQTTYGKYKAPSRISEWKREFDDYVKRGNLPRFSMLRLGVDHTSGTTVGVPSPRACVADNDYAVGQLVDAISHSPYWKSSAIFVVEDDAQAGEDHVDAHRSTSYVISPFIRKGTRDSRFYNTDSFLHTMDCLMGLPPLNQYVAVAPVLAVFGATPENDAPFNAILPDKAIIAERNQRGAYRANDSARLYHATQPDTGPDAEMNDILWHAAKGLHVPEPTARHGITFNLPHARKVDPDGDGD